MAISKLGKIFRCLLVAGGGQIKERFHWILLMYPKYAENHFISIAGHSSKPGRSKDLIRLMLNALSVNQIQQLCKLVDSQLKYLMIREEIDSRIEPESNDLRWGMTSLLKFIEMETSHGLQLQHLARRAVLRAVPDRSLPSAKALGIPKHMLEYLTFH